ncbi:MAG: DsbC family protein [Pseudomonadales bacterium]|nr:DsbC family protein [Pseudomonadales bacterium]
MNTVFRALVASLLLVGSASAQQDADLAWTETLKTNLAATLSAATGSAITINAVQETAFGGLIQVELSTGEKLFTDRSGEYLVTGDLYQAQSDGLVNLSAIERQKSVAQWIAAIPESEMIIFEPKQTRATITVFTDVDCAYCRRLHGDLEKNLANGIRVRYVAYPRGGEASEAYPKMINVWCSDDRQKSLTQAKHGQNIPSRECDNPVLKHYNLGNRIGISGTPAIVLEDGSVIPGYLEPDQLAANVFAAK